MWNNVRSRCSASVRTATAADVTTEATATLSAGSKSQRVMKEMWKLGPDLLDNSPVHINTIDVVLEGNAAEASL